MPPLLYHDYASTCLDHALTPPAAAGRRPAAAGRRRPKMQLKGGGNPRNATFINATGGDPPLKLHFNPGGMPWHQRHGFVGCRACETAPEGAQQPPGGPLGALVAGD